MRHVFIITLGVFLAGCATHPTIAPIPLKTNEVYTGLTFSVENIAPVFVYRRGLSDKSDYGVRIGLPIYGTGIDYSRVIYTRGVFRDIVNIAYSLNPNANLDLTYYSVRTFPQKPNNAFYTGFRIMYIPHGIIGGRSVRFGFLAGTWLGKNILMELGYFHDFEKGQPIEKLFVWQPANEACYPATTEYGFPSEYSRLVGLSCQVSLNTRMFLKKAKIKK